MLYLEHISFKTDSNNWGIAFVDKNGSKLPVRSALGKIFNRFFNYIMDFDLLILRIVGFFPIHTVRVIFYKLAGVKLGKGAHIHMGAQFFDPKGVEIGEGAIVGQNAFLDGRGKLKIGRFVDIASDVMIYNSEHDIHSEDFGPITEAVEIGDYCFIGPRAIILPGVKIGKGAVVGAGAVVTRDVDEFNIVGGVPAKVIGERKNKNPRYTLGRSRLFQ